MKTSKKRKLRDEGEEKSLLGKIFSPITFVLSLIFGWIKDRFYDFSVWVHSKFSKGKKSGKTKSMSTKRRNELIFFICLVAYPIAQFVIFYVAVNINSILLAFKEYHIETAKFSWIGFENFKAFIGDLGNDQSMIIATKNSLLLYGVGLCIGTPLNLIFSYFLYKKVPGHGFFRVVLFLPQIISSLVISLMFRYFVENGLAQLIDYNLLTSRETGFGTMIFYCVWAGFGSSILIYTSAMTKIDESIVEYGQLEGISLFQEFWHVTLPLIFPTITIYLVAGIAGLFTNQAGLFNFYGTGARPDMQTLGYVFFVKIVGSAEANYTQYPYAAAAGLLFTLIATPITLVVRWALEKFGPSVE